MSIQTLKKALGLLIIDVVIIIGIFVLQFRTDSSIIRKIGGLQITLAQMENTVGPVLKNTLRISYNGLNIYCDDQTPAVLTDENGEKKELRLENWRNASPLAFQFIFSDDVTLFVSLSSEDAGAELSLTAHIPEQTSLSIPYGLASNISVSSEDYESIVINDKKDFWEVSSAHIADGRLYLTDMRSTATYAVYTATQKFTFDSLADLPLASHQTFQRNVEAFKNNLISAFRANSSESNVSEQVVIAYISVMAERGQYSQALDEIPQSFKRGRHRTFLSAPYFGSLDEMSTQLDNSIRDYERRISESAGNGNLDIFTASNIASYISIHSAPATAVRLLEKAAASNIAEISVAQATGLMQVYVNLFRTNPDFAQILEPVMDDCVERITEACSFENNVLTLSENDTFLSVIQAVETGTSILRYGILTGNTTLQEAGYVLVNSYMAESSSFDLRTLANLFPIIAYDNPFIPHFEIFNEPDGNQIIAWTCAKNISYDKMGRNATLTIDFKEGDTHYIILHGLPQFTGIFIYDMRYRTDPRFETYNSSGYVYKPRGGILLLKSRHKADTEYIRFEF